MSSIKDKIFKVLRNIEPNTKYHDNDSPKVPRMRFGLVSNIPWRYSNKRHQNRLKYQVDYFSGNALNVENDPILWRIIDELEAEGLITSNWMESTFRDDKSGYTDFHYWIEVTGR